MATVYETTALANAQAAGITAAQAAQATYPQVATFAEITLGPNGESPSDFFWRHVKRYVVTRLAQAEHDADIAEKRARLKAKVQELADFLDVTIERVEEGGKPVKGPGWFVRKN